MLQFFQAWNGEWLKAEQTMVLSIGNKNVSLLIYTLVGNDKASDPQSS